MEYRVLASLREDLNQGWVWLTNSGLGSRSVVKITNKKNEKSIYCECLEIDDNYLFVYNNRPREDIDATKPTITVSSWYRMKLGGIGTKTKHELEVRVANSWWGKIRANLQHPQVAVRVATWLGIISIALGVVGFCTRGIWYMLESQVEHNKGVERIAHKAGSRSCPAL